MQIEPLAAVENLRRGIFYYLVYIKLYAKAKTMWECSKCSFQLVHQLKDIWG